MKYDENGNYIFCVGDVVDFEIAGGSRISNGIPRWDMNMDLGASGQYEQGKVVTLSSDEITVEFWAKQLNDLMKWKFPTHRNEKFVEGREYCKPRRGTVKLIDKGDHYILG